MLSIFYLIAIIFYMLTSNFVTNKKIQSRANFYTNVDNIANIRQSCIIDGNSVEKRILPPFFHIHSLLCPPTSLKIYHDSIVFSNSISRWLLLPFGAESEAPVPKKIEKTYNSETENIDRVVVTTESIFWLTDLPTIKYPES